MSKAYNFLSVTSVGSFYELKPRLTRGEGGEEQGKRNSSRMKIKGRDRHCNEKKREDRHCNEEEKREGHSQALEEKGRGDLTALLPLFWNPNKR